LDGRGAGELLHLCSRCVRVIDRDVRLPVRRDRCILEGHQSCDAGFADLEDPVAAEIVSHILGRPAEDLFVEALGAVYVGCGQLVPHEDTLRARALGVGLVEAHKGALRIGDDGHTTDLAHLEWAGRELTACALDLQESLVNVLDPDMAAPVRRRGSFHSFSEAAVALAARRDHRVVDLTGLEDFRSPTEQLLVELLRLGGVRGDLLVPDESADPRFDSAHLSHPLASVPSSVANGAEPRRSPDWPIGILCHQSERSSPQLSLGARVTPDLVQAVRELADAVTGPFPREIGAAIREHVANSSYATSRVRPPSAVTTPHRAWEGS